jgi:hypothetical protein
VTCLLVELVTSRHLLNSSSKAAAAPLVLAAEQVFIHQLTGSQQVKGQQKCKLYSSADGKSAGENFYCLLLHKIFVNIINQHFAFVGIEF